MVVVLLPDPAALYVRGAGQEKAAGQSECERHSEMREDWLSDYCVYIETIGTSGNGERTGLRARVKGTRGGNRKGQLSFVLHTTHFMISAPVLPRAYKGAFV